MQAGASSSQLVLKVQRRVQTDGVATQVQQSQYFVLTQWLAQCPQSSISDHVRACIQVSKRVIRLTNIMSQQ